VGDCATQKMRFETTPLVLEAAFDGGRLTSDGGLCWLAETDEELRLCEKIASHVPEWRKGASLRHSLKTLVRQRVLQIACGYEDQNDSNTLRSDPLLKLVCGRLPETDADLACVWPKRWANSTSGSGAKTERRFAYPSGL
jgi:hypothetical protein